MFIVRTQILLLKLILGNLKYCPINFSIDLFSNLKPLSIFTMDAALHRQPPLPNGSAAAHPAGEIPSDPSNSATIERSQSTHKIAKRKNKKKKQILVSDSASSASSNNCSCSTSNSKKGIKISKSPKRIRVGSSTTRRSSRLSDVDALGLPLGMSIAAVVAQVIMFNWCFCLKLKIFLLEIHVSLFFYIFILESLDKIFVIPLEFCVNFVKCTFPFPFRFKVCWYWSFNFWSVNSSFDWYTIELLICYA